MGGVVFVIGADYPEHWQRAQEAGFWESVRHLQVDTGDVLLFWQAGERVLLGVTIATHPTESVNYTLQSRPWLGRDPTNYDYRYRFSLVAGTTDPALAWGSLMTLVGANPRRGANTAPVSFDDVGAERLLAHFNANRGSSPASPHNTQSAGERALREALSRSTIPAREGQPYRRADERATSAVGVVFERDPEAVDRGLRGHARTQNLAADWLSDHGADVRSPQGGVNFDLAWTQDGVDYVGEVKSLHEMNESHQLRLGIGQVLEFAFRMQAKPVLILEREPTAEFWLPLCEQLGVALLWPERFDEFLT